VLEVDEAGEEEELDEEVVEVLGLELWDVEVDGVEVLDIVLDELDAVVVE
jgi:ribosome maturation factor RimP